MATELATDAAPRIAKVTPAHPLAPLSAAEIQIAAAVIKASWPAHTDLHFKAVTLQEPPKAQVLEYLEAEHGGSSRPDINRLAFINYYIRNTVSINDQMVRDGALIKHRANSTKRLLI